MQYDDMLRSMQEGNKDNIVRSRNIPNDKIHNMNGVKDGKLIKLIPKLGSSGFGNDKAIEK